MLRDEIGAMSRAKQVRIESFVYTAVFNTLGGTAQLTIPVAITNDSDFVIQATTLTSYSAVGVLVVAPDYNMQLLDTSSGRQLSDVPVHVGNWTGTAQWPFYWPEPYLLIGGGTLAVTLINNTPVASLVNVAFIGFKVYYLRTFAR